MARRRVGAAAAGARQPRRHPARRADARLTGFETCRRVKARPEGRVPVIFATGLAETEDIVRGFEAGGWTTSSSPPAPPRCWPGSPRTCATLAPCAWRARPWTWAASACWWWTRAAAWPGAHRRRSAGCRMGASDATAWLQATWPQLPLPDGRRLVARRVARPAWRSAVAAAAARHAQRRRGPEGPPAASPWPPSRRARKGAELGRQRQDQPRRGRDPGHEPAHGETSTSNTCSRSSASKPAPLRPRWRAWGWQAHEPSPGTGCCECHGRPRLGRALENPFG